MSISLAVAAADYTQQGTVTNWPVRILLLVVMVGVIALALWGMRRGWVHRTERQVDVPAPADAPPPGTVLGTPVPGLFAGTGTNGDWMDRIVVHDLGVRSRAELSYGPDGVWLDRVGARSVFIPGHAIAAIRADRGVAGTVRDRDGMVVISWRLGDRVLDTGFRADAGADHQACLDGLMSTFAAEAS